MVIVPVERRIDWKRPPIVLIGLVIVNILTFAFYQSNDDQIAVEAMDAYAQQNLFELELNAYRAFLRKQGEDTTVDKDDPYLLSTMVFDPQFATFMESDGESYIHTAKRRQWRAARAEVQRHVSRISSNALGMNSEKINPITILTHQFLHGNIDHILGNMVFLILTGFAVEAALGSLRFLGYYLLSGAAGGLLFAAFDSGSASLIGASGAISGVMAMYVVLFGMRKIEFFYWIFIVTGYFRAAAIIMLPAYLIKELVMMFALDGSNVAFTAHLGGFLAGAILVYATQQLSKSAIDDDYLDNAEQPIDPYLVQLAQLYKHIENCDFKTAWKELKRLQNNHRSKPELADIEYNLVLALNGSKADEYLLSKLGNPTSTDHIISAQAGMWNRLSADAKQSISVAKQNAFALSLIDNEITHLAESIFKEVRKLPQDQQALALLARRLASHHQQRGDADKQQRYDQFARDCMSNSIKPPNRLTT